MVAQRLGGTGQRIGNDQGCRGSQPAHLLGVDDAVPVQIAGQGPAGVNGFIAGHHVDHDPGPGSIATGIVLAGSGGAIGLSADASSVSQLGRNFQVIYEQANAHGQKVQTAGGNMAGTDAAVGGS